MGSRLSGRARKSWPPTGIRCPDRPKSRYKDHALSVHILSYLTKIQLNLRLFSDLRLDMQMDSCFQGFLTKTALLMSPMRPTCSTTSHYLTFPLELFNMVLSSIFTLPRASCAYQELKNPPKFSLQTVSELLCNKTN